MTTRLGLHHLSTSARNSPFGGIEKAGNSKQKAQLEPIKAFSHHKYLPVIPSPLATSPFLSAENKENAMTQTPVRLDNSCQTLITIPTSTPKITMEDLTSEEPTANYYQVMSYRKKLDIEAEMERNERLCRELGDVNEEINKIEHDLQILREVIAEMKEEEEGTSDL